MRRAITLVEIMLCITVLAIIAAILVPRPKVKPEAVVEVTSQEVAFTERFVFTQGVQGMHIFDKKTGIEYLRVAGMVFELTPR